METVGAFSMPLAKPLTSFVHHYGFDNFDTYIKIIAIGFKVLIVVPV